MAATRASVYAEYEWQRGTTHLFVALAEKRQRIVLCREDEDGRELGEADVCRAAPVGAVVDAAVEEDKDEEQLVEDADDDLAPREAAEGRRDEQRAVAERAGPVV